MVYHIVFNFLPSGTGCCNRYWCNQKVMGTSCNLFCWKCTAIAYSVLPLCQIVIYCKIDIKDPFPIKMSISNKYFLSNTYIELTLEAPENLFILIQCQPWRLKPFFLTRNMIFYQHIHIKYFRWETKFVINCEKTIMFFGEDTHHKCSVLTTLYFAWGQ